MPEYFHTLERNTGYAELKDAGCECLGFSTLALAARGSYEGITGEREALLVILSGTCNVEVGGRRFLGIGGRASVFAGPAHSVYLPRRSTYQVTALTALEAGLPTALSDLDTEPYEITPDQVTIQQFGALNYSRRISEILVEPNGRPASRLIVGENITPSGNWSTYPPHKHERRDPEGSEMWHEEIYYFRLQHPEGFGLVRHYSPERGYDHTYTVRDHTLLSIPHGYHTYVVAPGYKSYYLWMLAGDGRKQGMTLDPDLAWTQKVVGMI